METTTVRKNATFRKLGFKKMETAEIVSRLNISLSSYQVFFHKLQNFHWNIVGNDFMDVHDITQEMYEKGLSEIDELAERVRIFGQVPEIRLSKYIEKSLIKESSPDKSAEFMMYDLISDIEKLTETLLDVYECAAENGDIGSTYMTSKMVKRLETYHWKLSSWTNKKYAG